MTSKIDRFFNPNDGTYANVPIIPVNAEEFRGKRPFNTNVLIGNWYEDRSKFKESSHRSKASYRIDYPVHVGSVPDTVFRRKLLLTKEQRPGRMILDHHDIDDGKQMISSYDEQYTRRGPYGQYRDASERKWLLQDDYWLPERSDHPLEGRPTTWGLVEQKRSQSQCLRRQRTMPKISEYTDRYIPYRPEAYTASKQIGIPRIYSTVINRSISHCSQCQPTTHDPMEIDYLNSSRRNTNVPRAYFYLGRVPDTFDDNMREKLPCLPTPLNTNRPVTTTTMEQSQSQQQTVRED